MLGLALRQPGTGNTPRLILAAAGSPLFNVDPGPPADIREAYSQTRPLEPKNSTVIASPIPSRALTKVSEGTPPIIVPLGGSASSRTGCSPSAISIFQRPSDRTSKR